MLKFLSWFVLSLITILMFVLAFQRNFELWVPRPGGMFKSIRTDKFIHFYAFFLFTISLKFVIVTNSKLLKINDYVLFCGLMVAAPVSELIQAMVPYKKFDAL